MTYRAHLNKIVDTATHLLAARQAVALIGDAGVGKSRLAQRIASAFDPPFISISGRPTLQEDSLVGHLAGYNRRVDIDRYVQSITRREEKVTIAWRDGPLIRAMTEGRILLLDEFNRISPALQALLLPVLEDRQITLDRGEGQPTLVSAVESFGMIMTGNRSDEIGLEPVTDALRDRMVQLDVPAPDDDARISAMSEAGIEYSRARELYQAIVSRHMHAGTSAPQSFRPYLAAARLVARIAPSGYEAPPLELLDLLFPQVAA
ncbi:MAG: MoxR family ATPase [Pseudomonadota bacterium]